MQDAAVESRWLDHNGTRIHYLVAGNGGTPVLFLHGGGIDSASLSWGEVIAPLAERQRVLAPDLPGYGLSDRPHTQYTLDFYVNVVRALLDSLQLERVVLGGLSMGGSIALALTLAMPEKVEKLILVDSYSIQDRVAAHKLSYLYIKLPFIDELSFWLTGRSRSLVRWALLSGLIYNEDHLSSDLVEQVYQSAHEPGAGRAFISLQRNDVQWSGLRSNFTSRLHEISVPTLLIHGAQDQAVPLTYAQRAHQLIAGSQLAVMQECRHWPQRERPAEFIGLVKDFLHN